MRKDGENFKYRKFVVVVNVESALKHLLTKMWGFIISYIIKSFFERHLKSILQSFVFLRFPIFDVQLAMSQKKKHFFHKLQTLKLNSKKQKYFAFPKKKSLVGSTPGRCKLGCIDTVCVSEIYKSVPYVLAYTPRFLGIFFN